jgi:hypothetical protein
LRDLQGLRPSTLTRRVGRAERRFFGHPDP